ncbi:MAG: ABC transporter permease [Gemmatimonadaceae bacterium]|nr:ABC transporter permease [Gemmatimonadaceae bacterium]
MASPSVASITEGLLGLFVNPLRTSLSTIGVVIGVASVIATLTLADGLEEYAREQLAARTDVQSVTVASRTTENRDGFDFPLGGYVVFDTHDAAELGETMMERAEVTMVATARAIVSGAFTAPRAAEVTATLANFLDFGRRSLQAGRYFTDGEAARGASVVVLSHKLASELSPTGDPTLMLGRTIRVHRRPLVAVGIMPPFTGEQRYEVYIPVRSAVSMFGGGRALKPSLVVRASRFEAVNSVKAEIEEWLATRYRNWRQRVRVTTQLARIAEVQTAMLVFKLVMGSLAGIALFVGGVGIMNVLLASVTERTREIGVRKALGARHRDVLLQFLAESVAIAALGSACGTLLGLGAAYSLSAVVRAMVPLAPLRATVTVPTLLTAVVAAVVVGVAFGTFPALRAARLSPIDAIRHE